MREGGRGRERVAVRERVDGRERGIVRGPMSGMGSCCDGERGRE